MEIQTKNDFEIWKYVVDFEEFYQVSNFGNVRSLDRKMHNYMKKGRIMKPYSKKNGYMMISLSSETEKGKHMHVHRLVAQAFLDNPENFPEVNHIDFDKKNNRVENLEWVTSKQNKQHYMKSKRANESLYKRKTKSERKIILFIKHNKDKIIGLFEEGYTVEEISSKLNIGRDRISEILWLFDKM